MLPVFLQHLPELAKEQLLQHARAVQWGRGQPIVQAHEPAEALYALQSGSVRLYQLERTREVSVGVLLPGELLGCASLYEGGDYSLCAEALEDTAALRLETAYLRRSMQQCPEVCAALAAQVVRQTRNVQERLSRLVFMEVSQRLALALLGLLNTQCTPPETGAALLDIERPVELRGRISHQDLAYVAGSTRETITKLLGEFRARGYLELGYRRIIILSRSGLEQEAAQALHL